MKTQSLRTQDIPRLVQEALANAQSALQLAEAGSYRSASDAAARAQELLLQVETLAWNEHADRCEQAGVTAYTPITPDEAFEIELMADWHAPRGARS